MTFTEYPSMFKESDSLAKDSQRNHLRLVRSKVSLLVLVGVIAAVTWDQGLAFRLIGGVLLTTFLVLSISLTAIIHEKRFEETWFGARALAESIKAETWNFTMKLKQYCNMLDDNEAENHFLERLREIFREHSTISSTLQPHLHEGEQITPGMKRVRAEAFDNRKEIYIQNRIRDQMIWYSSKAGLNKKRASQWLIITWTFELLAVAFAVFTTLIPIAIASPVAIVLSASAGVLTWLNAKSYTEAAQSYGLVAQDLDILEEEAKRASTIDEFGKVVSEVETAINQEHRIWLGRVI
jgi:prepilin signal peptidase PulO-like enzyme (type II secretory pathway)